MRFLLALFCLFPALVWAEPTQPDLDMFSLLSSLLMVIAVIFGVAWVAKKGQIGKHFGGNSMKVVATLPLGGKERLLVVDIEGQQYLLGASAQGVNLIDKLDKPLAASSTKQKGFAEQFAGMLKKQNE